MDAGEFSLQALEGAARQLQKDFLAGKEEALGCVRRWHRRLRGRPNCNDRNDLSCEEVRRVPLGLGEARHIIAQKHQFETWPELVAHVNALGDAKSEVARFEAAVEAIVGGDARALRKLLREDPELVRARSTREHHATLLQYTGANAVEGYRQKTPKNIVEIARMLLKAGAEVDADFAYSARMMKLYPERKGSTTFGLAATSCHPAAAGVQIELLDLLLEHGASINGLPGGWNPVIAALHNGRGRAAAYMARKGARLDLEGAAGTGQVTEAKRFFGKDGELTGGATMKQARLGLLWACEYGHLGAVRFLVGKNRSLARCKVRETPLHWAAHNGHARIVDFLLKNVARVNAEDERFRGTPLGWALHGWCEPSPDADCGGYYRTARLLMAAGAKVNPAWLSEAEQGMPLRDRIRADARMRRLLRGKN